MIFDDTGLVPFLFEMSFKAGPASLAVAWAHSLVISIFGSDINTNLSTNLLSNSLSSAGGIFSTFLKSTFLWRRVFIRLMSLLVFTLEFLFSCSSMKSSLVSQGEQILALLPFCFERKPSACFPPLWRTTVCVSDWTKDEFSVIRFSDWLVGYSARILRGLYA